MAMKPNMLALSESELAEARKLEEAIDTILRNDFAPRKKIYEVNLGASQTPSARVANEVVRRYWTGEEKKSDDSWKSVRYNGHGVFYFVTN